MKETIIVNLMIGAACAVLIAGVMALIGQNEKKYSKANDRRCYADDHNDISADTKGQLVLFGGVYL